MADSKEKQPLLNNDASFTPGTVVEAHAPPDVTLHLTEYLMLVVGALGSIGMGAMPLLFYYFFGQLIGKISEDDDPVPSELQSMIQRTSYQFFVVAGVAGISSFFQTSMFLFVGERFSARLRRACFASITRQEIAYFDQTETGGLISRLSEDAQQVRDTFSEKLGQAAVSVAQFCGGLGYAFYLSWQLTIAMLLTAPLLGVAIAMQGFLTVKFTKSAADASASAVSTAEEVISSMRTVRSFSQEEKEVRRFGFGLNAIVEIANKRAVMTGFSLGFVQMFVWGACAVAFWVGGWLVGKDELQFGDLVTVFGMMLFAVIGLSVGLSTLPQFLKSHTSYMRVLELVDREPRIRYSGGQTLSRPRGEVSFDRVVFKYETREKNALQEVSFNVPVGKTVAIVGESGSGKSTVFSLIERFYDPTSGSVQFDGTDIRQLDLPWLHSQIAMVSQEPVLFGTTIAENIAYAKELATQEEIESAARTANAHEFIEKLPAKYDTKVGERGVQLSGGQKQRIAIARAVLCNPKILLLDEATSALDTQSEKLVQDALDRIMIGKTCLVIAHRLATVINADCIIVMQDGCIVEQGTHDELLALDGVYRNLAQRQLMNTNSVPLISSSNAPSDE